MRPRILIVEDDSSLAQILRDNLIVDGFDVECASHADKALALYRSFVPALVLVDVMLPDLSGFELARVLQTRWKDADHHPVSPRRKGRQTHGASSRGR